MIKSIIFDFDGVILESNDVKIDGFYKLFEKFGNDKALMASNYFATNAGLSRYDVIDYFFSTILGETATKDRLSSYAKKYSDIVKDEVIKSRFVHGCEEFLAENSEYDCFVVSSSDEDDLKYICENINIDKYFKDILGSPTKKAVNIKKIISEYNLEKNETIYIGDSINDYHSTMKNDIGFIGRNSGVYDFTQIEDIVVIDDLKNLNKIIKALIC